MKFGEKYQRQTIAGIVAAALISLSSPSYALFGGGGLGGGATEITQLLNHAELIVDTAQQIQTAINTLRALEQLPGSIVSEILGPVEGDLESIVGMINQLQDTKSSYQSLINEFRGAMQSMSALNMTPSQYLKFRAKMALSQGGVYQASVNADLQALQNASKQSKSLSQMLNAHSSITSQVGGLQAIANSNAKIIATLETTQNSLINANSLAAQEKADAANLAANAASNADASIAARQALPPVNLNFADPNSIGFSSKSVQPSSVKLIPSGSSSNSAQP